MPAFDPVAEQTAETLITLALWEDLHGEHDLTSQAMIPSDAVGNVQIVARVPGVLAGCPLIDQVANRVDAAILVQALLNDGDRLLPGLAVATLAGPVRSLLTAERTILNFLTALSGVATLTHQFVEAVVGTKAVILDTRKTWPGWRALQKYAVRCGGGTNHRLGLYDGVLIKDNHLGAWQGHPSHPSIAAAIEATRERIGPEISVEVEVDTLDQLRDAVRGRPDIVLLDNMDALTLCEAVRIRDELAPGMLLEASGGISLTTVSSIAKSGVERISIGGLTHSAPALDLGFDWV